MKNENKLYLIGIKCKLSQLVDMIEANGEPNNSFWKKICIFEYDTNEKFWTVKNLNSIPTYHIFYSEPALFSYMDEEEINFVSDDNPLGIISYSYSTVYLEIVRWAAEVVRVKEYYNSLIQEW